MHFRCTCFFVPHAAISHTNTHSVTWFWAPKILGVAVTMNVTVAGRRGVVPGGCHFYTDWMYRKTAPRRIYVVNDRVCMILLYTLQCENIFSRAIGVERVAAAWHRRCVCRYVHQTDSLCSKQWPVSGAAGLRRQQYVQISKRVVPESVPERLPPPEFCKSFTFVQHFWGVLCCNKVQFASCDAGSKSLKTAL